MHCIHTYALHLSLSLVSLHVHCTYIVHICIASMHFRCRIFLASIDVNCIYAFAMHMYVPCMYPCVLHLCICIASMHVPCIYAYALHPCMCIAYVHYASPLCICLVCMPIYIYIYMHIYIYKAKFIRVDRLPACSLLGVPIRPTRPC